MYKFQAASGFRRLEGADTAIVVTRAELENLKYILRQYAHSEVSRGMLEQVSNWLSVLANDDEVSA